MEKIDFRKSLKHLYSARQKIAEVDAGEGYYLSVEGKGAPGGGLYQEAIQKLYGVAYTLKFTLKNEGVLDFGVCSLEGLYFDDPEQTPMEDWRWQLLIRIPDAVTDAQLRQAVAAIRVRKEVDASDVKRVRLGEGRSLQILHVGPYDQVGPTYDRLKEHVLEHEMTVTGPPHEIYLSDPRRTAPEKLRTIVRIPVR